MIQLKLKPSIDLLREEFVLVQAWKKASSYIRTHNWYSDTLALDLTSVRLRSFIEEMQQLLADPSSWKNDPLRMVPAPKSQVWQIRNNSDDWGPADPEEKVKIRPLAHVTVKDQVVATALALCLADRLETDQGDPTKAIDSPEKRKQVISYGNRLLCDSTKGQLVHRWGSSSFYRSYYTDYRRFLSRPDMVAESHHENGDRVFIVHSDLSQFYDRVTPQAFITQLGYLQREGDDGAFFNLVEKVLCWSWHPNDSEMAAAYAKDSDLPKFDHVVLPQGLVASGFFANLCLRSLDRALIDRLGNEYHDGLQLIDACRYVDDLRLVVVAKNPDVQIPDVESATLHWLQGLLDAHAEGMLIKQEKTVAVEFRGSARPLIRQSRSMERIQKAVSGGFDALGGVEILDAVQGLIRAQERFNESSDDGKMRWRLSPIPDVRDATVMRFAAARFRSTYRSLRPLLEPEESLDIHKGEADSEESGWEHPSAVSRTQEELDEDARSFALGLIENWIEDPANVRLLRIGLDIWPSESILEEVLSLLRLHLHNESDPSLKRVAVYCLAEVLRAGATETGFVEDEDQVSDQINLGAYRAMLLSTAKQLLTEAVDGLPWYLLQQARLFIATQGGISPNDGPVASSDELLHYKHLLQVISGTPNTVPEDFVAPLLVVTRRAFSQGDEERKGLLLLRASEHIEAIAKLDTAFALEVLTSVGAASSRLSESLQKDMCIYTEASKAQELSALSTYLLTQDQSFSFRNELTVLRFATSFLEALSEIDGTVAVRPSEVFLKCSGDAIASIDKVEICSGVRCDRTSMYSPPSWCEPDEGWRFQLGYMMRFILSANADFTRNQRSNVWREQDNCYRRPESSWYQRLYGFFNGQASFGAEWLPISDWLEDLLFFLVRWPGCPETREFRAIGNDRTKAISVINGRIEKLDSMKGKASGSLLLPLRTSSPGLDLPRALRVCVVQSVRPSPLPNDFDESDLTFSKSSSRRWHRGHISSALASVERLLHLRDTHRNRDGRIDMLLLPELAVHPTDLRTHIIPFARRHRAIVFAGMTYSELCLGGPLVNAAAWIVPTLSATRGLQMRIRFQGKAHLAPLEEDINSRGGKIQGWRPAQWLVGYQWDDQKKPLWLTGAICYDATDISLASDLREHSDVFAVLALNKDIDTFDHMAQALHFHMYQAIIVANNGTFGGSNAYIPYKESFMRQVFHLHGQPQATVAFFEIDELEEYSRRVSLGRQQATVRNSSNSGDSGRVVNWKCPPAGLVDRP